MNLQITIVQEIIKRLLVGQENLAFKVQALATQDDYADMSMVLMFEVSHLFMENSDQVDWKRFMQTVEELLMESSSDFHKTVVRQSVLEAFAIFISDGGWEPHWIASHIGPQSRRVIQEYDELMGTQTPGI